MDITVKNIRKYLYVGKTDSFVDDKLQAVKHRRIRQRYQRQRAAYQSTVLQITRVRTSIRHAAHPAPGRPMQRGLARTDRRTAPAIAYRRALAELSRSTERAHQ